LRHQDQIDAVGNKIETALMSHAPKIVWKREAIATALKIRARRPRPPTLSIEQMAAVLDSLQTPHLFRFAIVSLCTWARPQAIIDFDPATQVDRNGGFIDLAPVGWVPTKKRRPRQPLTGCLAGWLPVWDNEDAARRGAALAENRIVPECGLIVYKGKRVAKVKRSKRPALISFAHFERELGSEGVRDKVAASKRKGKWTGTVPLRYDVKLVINVTEAETVRTIFRRRYHLELRSFGRLVAISTSEALSPSDGRPRSPEISGRHSLHTGEVQGSIPCAPTRISIESITYTIISRDLYPRSLGVQPGYRRS
jgi:hypothetical protein